LLYRRNWDKSEINTENDKEVPAAPSSFSKLKLTTQIEKVQQIIDQNKKNSDPTKPDPQSVDTDTSSGDENLAQLRARIRARKKMKTKSKKLRIDEVVEKLNQKSTDQSDSSKNSDDASIIEKPRIVENGEQVKSFVKSNESSGSSSEAALKVDFSPAAVLRRVCI
jgi:hypothetical protein